MDMTTHFLRPKRAVFSFFRTVKTHKLFVYGTLKRNEPNHHLLQDKTKGFGKYSGQGHTMIKYPLVIATKNNIPFMLYSPGKGHLVRGEMYDVDDKMLSHLDAIEGHPVYYERQLEDVIVRLTNRSEIDIEKCWVYFLKKFKKDLLTKPHLESYSSKGDHNLPYVGKTKRDPNYDILADIL